MKESRCLWNVWLARKGKLSFCNTIWLLEIARGQEIRGINKGQVYALNIPTLPTTALQSVFKQILGGWINEEMTKMLVIKHGESGESLPISTFPSPKQLLPVSPQVTARKNPFFPIPIHDVTVCSVHIKFANWLLVLLIYIYLHFQS